MTDKIFRSTFFTSLIVLLASLVLVMGVLFGAFENRITEELGVEAQYVSQAVESEGAEFLNNLSSDNRRITLIAQNGDVIADTHADARKMKNHSNRTEFKQALKDGTGTSVHYSDTLTEKTVYFARRLENGDVLRISTTMYTVISILLGLMQPIVYILIAALALSFFLSKRVSKSVIKPINAIDLDNPEKSDTYEELSPLLRKIVKQNRTIREQIKNERQFREEFSLITDNMSEGFLVIDKDAELLSCNNAALRLFGASEPHGNVLTLNRTDDFRKTVDEVLSGKHAENTMTHTDRTYRLIANPVFGDKNVIGAVIVIIDITESAQREEIRREFTANVSHELKTPLTSISGFAELMKDGGMSEDTVRDFANSIYTEAQRLITLVNDIIKISRLDEGADLERENVDLLEISENAAQTLKASAEKKNVKIAVNGESATIFGVRQILEEMVYNLLDNAVKYNKDGGTAAVNIENLGSEVKLTVWDTGIGIDPSQQERIFERFYRVDKSRSKAEGGTGLGLSIVKHGAMYHGAALSVKSSLGEGTEIVIRFKNKTKGGR